MRYRFGDRELDTETRELTCGGRAVEVEPQVFDVLAYLLANRDRVVPKEELLDEIWGDRFVSESAITTRIKQARQAVGDSGREQGVIKTLHGRGYRFVAEVSDHHAEQKVTHAAISSIPRTRYADGDGASIAYQTFGEGPDVVFIAGFTTNVEVQWEHPAIAAFLRRLGSFSRVTILDKRGVGLSDRMPDDNPPSLETRADDLLAVMEAADVPDAVLLGSSEGGSLSAVFAATHPDKANGLILHNTWVSAASFGGVSADATARVMRNWGSGGALANLGPSLGADDAGRSLLARLERQAATPRAAGLLIDLMNAIDITEALRAVTVPTLVLHRVADPVVPVSQGHSIAELVPDAQLVELGDADHWIFSGDTTPVLDAIERFVTGSPERPRAVDRSLATLLVVDLVDPPVEAEETIESAARVIAEHRGVVVCGNDAGVLATFDGPGRAVQAAGAVTSTAGSRGATVRCGVHTAEIERRGDDVGGTGVQIARSVAAAATANEVLVSRTVTDLVAGTGLRFVERGTRILPGVEHPWALYAAQF